jgi:hypothetical protein
MNHKNIQSIGVVCWYESDKKMNTLKKVRRRIGTNN